MQQKEWPPTQYMKPLFNCFPKQFLKFLTEKVESTMVFEKVIVHPWAGENFSFKIDVDDQNIWKSTLGL